MHFSHIHVYIWYYNIPEQKIERYTKTNNISLFKMVLCYWCFIQVIVKTREKEYTENSILHIVRNNNWLKNYKVSLKKSCCLVRGQNTLTYQYIAHLYWQCLQKFISTEILQNYTFTRRLGLKAKILDMERSITM